MALNKNRNKLACQVSPATYEWIKAETKRRGMRGEGYLIDELVEEIKQLKAEKKK